MEPVGFTIGVVALFSVCIDIVDKFDNFKTSGQESRGYVAIFEADKKRLRDWAHAVGLSDGKLEDVHNSRLDDSEIAKCVELVLRSICETLGAGEQTQSRLKTYPKGYQKSLSKFEFPTEAARPSANSLKSGLDWTFRRRGRFVGQVEMFRNLLDRLHDIVPPSQDSLTDLPGIGAGLQSNMAVLVKEIRESAQRQALKNVDEWLDATMSDLQFEDCLEARLEGTCEWIFEHPMFQTWTEPKQESIPSLLWINGSAGQGKSVLCAKIIQYLRSTQSQPCAYFFSSAHARAGGKPKEIIRSWISQLARQDHEVLDTIRGYKDNIEMGNFNNKRALQYQVWDILEEVLQIGSHYTLILDGLDEYDRTDDNVATFLGELKNRLKNTNTRVLLVSRNEIDIRLALLPQDNELEGWHLLDCQISEDLLRPDITRFSQQLVDQKLKRQKEQVRQQVSQQMVDKCQGMFLWIKMQKEELRSTKSAKQLHDIVNKMPVGLTKTYERNWRAIQSKSEDDRERAIAILRWVVFAVRPLTVSEITDALLVLQTDEDVGQQLDEAPEAIDDEYINEEIKRICESLVDVRGSGLDDSPASHTLQLVHFSVREFLLSVLSVQPYIPSALNPSISTEDYHHGVLAEYCLRYITCSNVWQSDIATNEGVRPFVCYASEYWHNHYRPMDSVLSILLRFFSEDDPNFLSWRKSFESAYVDDKDNDPGEKFKPSTPLYYAALFGCIPSLEIPSEQLKRDLNRAEGRFGSPLSAACSKGHSPSFERLIELGADINVEGGHFGSALNAAISADQEEMVRKLLALGANHKARDSNGGSPVYIASRLGLTNIVTMLLENGGDVNTTNKYSWTPLNAAAQAGDVDIVKVLIQNEADPSIASQNGWTPLNSAADEGHLEVVRMLLDGGADSSIACQNGWTPLNNAARNGHLEVVRLLLDQGADLNTVSQDGWTPLNNAAESGHLEIIQLLLDKGADLSIVSQNGWTPLNNAAENGHLKTVQLLLDHGADLNIPNQNQWTPLNNAAESGHLNVVQLLFDKGADSSIPNEEGWTPLNTVADQGNLDMMKLLLDNGADPSIGEKDGWTPLHIATDRGHIDVVRLLLDREADSCIASQDGSTPLHLAAYKGHLEIAQLLLDRGADSAINGSPQVGMTPLNNAANKGHLEVIRLLLDRGVDVTIEDECGWTALNLAAYNGHLEVVQLLLDRGAELSINVINEAGWPPLVNAASNGHLDIVRLLLDRGADLSIDISDENGWTSLNLAADRGHLAVVQLLLDRGADSRTAAHNGWTPLHSACNVGELAIVKLLLSNINSGSLESAPIGLSDDGDQSKIHQTQLELYINAVDSSRQTATHIAAQRAYKDVLQLLIENGANPTLVDDYGRSCLDWASASEPLLQATGSWCHDYRTPSIIEQKRKLWQNVQLQIQKIRSDSNTYWHFGVLARSLLLLSDLKQACIAFEQKLTYDPTTNSIDHDCVCDQCSSTISANGLRYVCLTCHSRTICAQCKAKLETGEADIRCKGHQFLQIPHEGYDPENVSALILDPDAQKAWLDGLAEKYSHYVPEELE